ncbi:alpha-(1-_3)-arabinofuranosyltransferase domain-containing protein [Gordonia sp. CPCC 205333]|uniref:alpha-(1->3)-arabinofuranosyltransferase domain-containing protein n=1 Tax=Gordonia sp. CPCC 205333 TaxID=3140790 RepID=UPI003AF35CF2
MTPPALSRRGVAWIALAALLLSFLQAPGRLAADTKLDLTANPVGFLQRALHLWTPTAPMGQVQNQAYGYFFPHGAFYALGELCHLPPWVTQRLWWAVLLFVGFIGIVRLAELIGVGSPTSRLIAAAAFVLSPRVLTTLGSISSETLPMMLAPWVLIPVIRALDTERSTADPPLWRLAFQSAAAIALMGAVNAVATVAACGVSILWFVMHRPTARWARFGGWWVVGAAAACAWWVVPLLILSRVSPPFLDFIESSRVTTEWTSLTEVLRGTSSWTPFVSPERVAGSILVTQPAAVVATGVLVAAGLAGLAMRQMPFRRRFAVIVTVGIVLICVGYAGGLGSPIAEPIRTFLDGAGAPLRNVHKVEPLIRIPVVLGIAHLLARAPLPGSVRIRESLSALAHPQRSKTTAASIVILVALLGAGSVAWTGGLAGTDTYRDLPGYWRDTAQFLAQHAAGADSGHPGRTLVVPGSPFAQQLWGLTRDEPIQPLATTPWAVRDAIPLVPPEAIRAMDSVQRAIADGRPSPGLAATLAQQGIGYVVLRADLTPIESRSARPLLAQHALAGSPGLHKIAQFGPDVGPATVDGVVVDDGLRPKMPAIQIFAVTDGVAFDGTGPILTDLDDLPRFSGGPESLAALQDYRARRGYPALGPALFEADARRAGLPRAPLTVTDAPVDRETDFGRVDDHNSSTRSATEPRRTKNASADYPVVGQSLVSGHWLLNNDPGRVWVTTSGSASDATQPGQTSPADSPAAAFDHDTDTSWISSGLDAAVGQWLQLNFDTPRSNLALTLTTHKAIGPDVTGIVVTTDTGTTVAQGIEPGEPVSLTLPGGPTSSIKIRALRVDGGVAGNQFALSEIGIRDLVTGMPMDIRFRADLPPLPTGSAVARWYLSQELDGRSACVPDRTVIRCSPAVGRSAETSGVFSRMLSVPAATNVDPVVVLRPKAGTDLNATLTVSGVITATGPASVTDPRGNAMALVDGDPATVWTAPDSQDSKKHPTVVLNLPAPQRVDRIRLTGPQDYPARPVEVTVDAGDGRHTHRVDKDGYVDVGSARTQRLSITIGKSSSLIDVNGLGFARPAQPGIGEIEVFPTAPASASLDRPVTIGCDRGLGITAAGQVVRLKVSTTARALRNGDPVLAYPCEDTPLRLPTGRQEISVNPSGVFNVVGVDLSARGPDAPTDTAGASVRVPRTLKWDVTHRQLSVPSARDAQVIVVPESANSGWRASIDGSALTSITVNGWQQGWIVPAGKSGIVDLTFRFDSRYRWALGVGLTLMALLLVAAWWPRRWSAVKAASQPADPMPGTALRIGRAIGVGAVSWLLCGWWGLGITALGWLGFHWLRRHRREQTVPAITFISMLAATWYLAAGPWHSPSGYHGFDWLPQLFALIALNCVWWSAGAHRREPRDVGP